MLMFNPTLNDRGGAIKVVFYFGIPYLVKWSTALILSEADSVISSIELLNIK